MKNIIKIGYKKNDWTVISEPIIENGKRKRKIQCSCSYIQIVSESYINKSIFSESCRKCGQIRRRNRDGERKYNVGDILMNIKILKTYSGKKISYKVKCLNCNNEYHTGHSILNKKYNNRGLPYCHNCFDISKKKKKRRTMMTKHISLTSYKRLKHEAERRGIEFNVTPEYLQNIYNGYCYFSGIKIDIGTYLTKNGKIDSGTASLDRLNLNIGYVDGNVVWVYKPINIMKNKLGIEKFIDLCKKIVEHQQNI